MLKSRHSTYLLCNLCVLLEFSVVTSLCRYFHLTCTVITMIRSRELHGTALVRDTRQGLVNGASYERAVHLCTHCHSQALVALCPLCCRPSLNGYAWYLSLVPNHIVTLQCYVYLAIACGEENGQF